MPGVCTYPQHILTYSPFSPERPGNPNAYYVDQCFGTHTETHTDTHTHIDMDALQSFTTGQNVLYAAEIFKILTHSQHPDREDIYLLYFFFL